MKRAWKTTAALAALMSASALGAASVAAPALAAPAAPAATAPTPATAKRLVLPAGVTPSAYDIAVTPDMEHATFTGRVRIAVTVDKPTRTITLNAAELTFSHAVISGQAGDAQTAFDAEQQTATLTFPQVMAAGAHMLTIDYAGKINEHAAGLFSLDYDAEKSAGAKEGGARKRALFTQFENSDARRFVPSWDEPNKKAAFTLTVVVPQALMPVSNMPAASEAAAGAGMKRVTFTPTPKMSSYLLFFGLGDFERIHRQVDGVDVGVVFKRGDADQATYALDAAAHILTYYNDYFGVKFPLPKLDMIAGAGQSQFFGAMENWGAIFYFERDVLIDPQRSSEEDKQRVYTVVAHEMAHQWFGDLVTMDWWDDLWLNEGFASWMENKATDHFHPEWNLWLQGLGSKQGAMSIDARRGTHPIITPISDVLQANQAFDTITYQKGQAVIRMLESYAGEDAWRAGVRRYIKAHAYGNTVTDDLWAAVDAESPKKITDIAHDFTLQAGVPLVTAQAAGSGVTLTQGRYGVDDESKAPRTWRVPVQVAPQAGSPVSALVSGAAGVAVAAKPPMVINAGQTGYFRTLYSPALLAPLKADFAMLKAEDQYGLLNDAASLGGAGYAPYADVLDLTSTIPAGADPIVAEVMVNRLVGIDDLYKGSPNRPAWRAHARAVIAPLFARLGWEARPGESDNTKILRASTIQALGRFDDPAVLAEAAKRFTAYRADPSSLPPTLKGAVLNMIAAHADAAGWEVLHDLARRAPTALEKQDAYVRLSLARDPVLARRALDLAISGEPEKTTAPSMIGAAAGEHPALALDFAIAHADALNAMLEPDSRNQFVPRIARASNDVAAIAKLDAYAQAHIPATARSEVVKAESAITYAAKVKATVVPQADKWLASHPG